MAEKKNRGGRPTRIATIRKLRIHLEKIDSGEYRRGIARDLAELEAAEAAGKAASKLGGKKLLRVLLEKAGDDPRALAKLRGILMETGLDEVEATRIAPDPQGSVQVEKDFLSELENADPMPWEKAL